MYLYWVTTEDHDEDWFVIAPNAKIAAEHHEAAEGYDPGDAKAERILNLPMCSHDDIGWPSHEILLRCGAEIISEDSPRIVIINGRRFCEGMLESEIIRIDDDILETKGQKRLNRTSRRPAHVS